MSDNYIVEAIIDKRIIQGRIEYLIKWLAYSIEESTCELLQHLKSNSKLIQDFELEKKKNLVSILIFLRLNYIFTFSKINT